MMQNVEGLTRDDPGTISFVLACLFCQAISLDEMKQWSLHIVMSNRAEEIPSYIFELIEYEGSLAGVVRTIGFSPDDGAVSLIEPAIYGIAFERGVDVYDPPITKRAAGVEIRSHPEVLDTFFETFPFIAPFDLKQISGSADVS
ncbi:hypothetical protein [Nocardia amikacinitolerans]|uniref:hypothetical protein n=1 Tax=Nocardia amikacinitolerans TaxID=756689 RepID=UPI0020A51F33|nr:hypothetical protein [Nocardia amikacinitolerans]